MWGKTALLSAILAAAAWAQDAKKEEEKKKDEEAKAKVAEFKKQLKTAKSDADITGALKALGELQHSRVLAELKTWLSKSTEVCAAAGEEIGKYSKDKEAAEMLMTAAGGRKDKDGIVKCLRYAGDTSYKGIAGKLTGFFRHKDVDVAREAIDSCAKIKSKEAVDPLIILLKELDSIKEDQGATGGGGLGGGLGGGVGGVGGVGGGANEENQRRKSSLTNAVVDALEKTTGASGNKTPKDWQNWWSKNKGSFKEQD